MHKHKPTKTRQVGWCVCITPDACAAYPVRQSAHGGIVRIDYCACGATRRTEVNGPRNRGRWEETGEIRRI